MKDLENDFLKENNNFPRNLVSTQKLLLNYKGAGEGKTVSKEPLATDGILFAQNNENVNKSNRLGAPPDRAKTLAGITCRDCNETGHYQGNPACSVQTKMKEDAEKYRAMATPVAAGTPKKKVTTGEQMLMYGNIEYDTPSAVMFCQTSRIVEPLGTSPATTQECRSEQAQSFQYDKNVLSQAEAGNGKINKDWILLDSQST